MREVVRGWAWACALMLCGCHFSRSEHPDACKSDDDCKSGNKCESGYCVALEKSGKSDDGGTSDGGGKGGTGAGGSGGHTGGDAGGMTDSGGGSGGSGDSDAGNDAGMMMSGECTSGAMPEDCYDGPKKTQDVGVCRGGQRACIDGKYTPCLGQVLPSMEMCNGKDDNCDGHEDEFAMDADCSTAMKGVCKAGALVCRGNYAVCEPVNTPSDEVCNGKDDDCDGTNDDNITATQCYPANTVGCALDNGTLKCTGMCQAGHSACSGGNEGCPDAVTPVTEVCTTGSDLAADEDCDGKIDEGCNCTDNATRDCYSGPVGTEGHDPCHVGTQRCSTANNPDGEWSPCSGEVTPQRETCDNIGVDDDCDTTTDNYPDIPGLGTACLDDTKQGICHDGTWQCKTTETEPVCVGASPQHELCDDIDQDCNGEPANGYDLSTDPKNCGMCGHACNDTEDCCNGVCSGAGDYRFDRNNCGKCGLQCGFGQYCCWNDCMVGGGKGGIVLPGPDSVCGCKDDCGDKWCCFDGCVDIMNDEKNCGRCGNVCPNDGIIAQVCCEGQCTTAGLCNVRF